MNDNPKQILKHWGIWLFILITLNLGVLFWVAADGQGNLFDQSEREETQEGSEDGTNPSTESEFVSYPEGAIKIDSYEQKMTYFRNWCLYFLFIPEQLGDQCTVSVKLPELNGENGGWQEYLESTGERDWLPAFYFGKGDELYYSDYQMLTWEEEALFKEQKTLYLNNVRSNSGSFSVRKTDEIIDEFENNYLMISGELKQEIYEPNEIALKYWKWGGLMEVVGFWHMEQTGQCFGTLKGDIYVTDYSDNECWICIDGLDPVKFEVPSTNLTLRLRELPAMIENVEFDDAEKEKVKAYLSFDLKVEALNDVEKEETPATEAVTEATKFTEWIPVIRYPEGAVIIDDDEQKMMYFRNWYLSYFEIPDELGDSCYISVRVPWLEGKYGKRSASVRLYYQKEDTYYRSSGELGWDEGISLDLERRTVYLHDVKHNAAPYNFEKIDLMPENNAGQTTDYLQISGNLSQEIYPAGQGVFKSRLWANILEAVGFWHGEQSGELFGNIKGEVYVMNVETGESWICLAGMEPIKVLHTNTSWYRMKEAYTPIEGVLFSDEEKSGAQARLSFNLKVESLQEQ